MIELDSVYAVLKFEEEIARKKTIETSVTTASSRSEVVSSVNVSSTQRSELLSNNVSTSRPASPRVVSSQPAVVSSQPPVHVLRLLPHAPDTSSQPVRPASAAVSIAGLLSSQPSWSSVATAPIPSRFRPVSATAAGFQAWTSVTTAASIPSHFRPVSATAAGFQAAFSRTVFSSHAASSHHPLLSQSAIQSGKSRLPFSSSTPNLVATGSKHVLVDSSTGQVITTVLPPAGNGHRLDDGRLGKNSSFMPAMSSASAVRFILTVSK